MSPPAAAQSQSEDYNWNGFYGGGNLGGGFGGSDFLSSLGRGVPFYEGEVYPGSDAASVAAVARVRAAFRSNHDTFGAFTGGIQAGYNFRSGGLVYGLEGDINFVNARTSKTTSALGNTDPAGPATYTFRSELDANYVATLRPRVGLLMNGTLLYATGGLAVTTLHYKHDFRGTGGFFAGGPDITEHASKTETKLGWTVGAGVETPVNRWTTIRAEYSVAGFGDVESRDNKISPLLATNTALDAACGTNTNPGLGNNLPFPVPNPTPRQCFNHKADLLLHSIRLGVNFKF